MFWNKKNSTTNNFQLSVTQLSWKIRTTHYTIQTGSNLSRMASACIFSFMTSEWTTHLISILQHFYYQVECVINIRSLESTQYNVVFSKEKCKVDTCMLSSFQSLDILGRKQEQRLKYSYLPKPESNIDDIYEYDDNKQQKQNVMAWCFRGT